MAFSESELKLHERAVQAFIDGRRPPPEIRDELDLGFRIEGQSITIFGVRPHLLRAGEKTESGVAKTTHVKSSHVWKVYWMRADLKWHRYEPVPEVDTLEAWLELVDRDAHGAFFG